MPPEAGFLDLPPRDVVSRGQPAHLAATARLFYNLRPADEAPEDKPIFVLFNGFAAEIVRAFGTGPTTVAEGGEVVENPSSLTKIANLVYLDPRQAGFSYDVSAAGAATAADCSSAVFNEYVDAADALLGTLKFLSDHPRLRGPVYWVGESYAGVRVQWILAYLRGRWDLAGYQDEALKAAILGSTRQTSLLAGQILIQPWLAGKAHTDAIAAACLDPAELASVSASLGAPCEGDSACACADAHHVSRYNTTYPVDRQNARELEASLAHVLPERAKALFGLPLDAIAGLDHAEREKGFKCSPPDDDVPPEEALRAALGALPEGQAYYVPYSPLLPGKETAPTTLDWREANLVGAAFLDNLRDVPTFATDGARDLVVPTRALVPALRALAGAGNVTLLSPPRVRVATPDGDRFIDLGSYPDAGHMVTMIDPLGFSRDVTAWIDAR
jgi:serine carboxypeptidase